MLLNARFPQKALVYEGRPAAYWQKPNEFGWTVAHYAAGKGHVKLLMALKAWGVNLWTPGTGGRTPAHWAATNGHRECLSYLLEIPGADVNASNNAGWALVHCAACQNNVECMQLLLEKGANPEAKNNKGETARGATRSNKVRQVIDKFIDKTPDEHTDPSSKIPDEHQPEGQTLQAPSWDAGISRGRQGTAPQNTFRLNAKAREFMPTSHADSDGMDALSALSIEPTDSHSQGHNHVDAKHGGTTDEEASGPERIGEGSTATHISADQLKAIRAQRRAERAKRKALQPRRR